MVHQPKLAFLTEEILTKEQWDPIILNDLIFIKTDNWTLLINNAAPQIDVQLRCPTCFGTRLNPYILVGSGTMKGLMNCTSCATNVIVSFPEKEVYEFLKKVYKIDQNLIDENWKPESQSIQ